MPLPSSVTQLLEKARDGDVVARDELLRQVYDELRRIAACYLQNEQPDHTLQPTALVHELCVQLLGADALPGESRSQFFVAAAQAMRHILVDHARTKGRVKRGGGRRAVGLDEQWVGCEGTNLELLALDEALQQLAAIDSRKGQVVELRYFGGLTFKELAEHLGVSVATVERDWDLAKTWLLHELRKGDSHVI